MEEIWKDVVGYEGHYQVSSLSRIKSLSKTTYRNRGGKIVECKTQEKILKANISGGYMQLVLWLRNKRVVKRVHRLVAEHFIPNPENKGDVNHKDGNKANNKIINLEWATRSENILHAYRTGLQKQNRTGFDSRRKPVVQYDLNGQYLTEFSGRHEAARQTGINQSLISACCVGRCREAGGFKWASK